MTVSCPYCGGQLTSNQQAELSLKLLPHRLRRIYNTMLEAGPIGVTVEYLIETVWPEYRPESAYGMLRVGIHELNKKLASINGHRIRGSRGNGYYLITPEQERKYGTTG